MAWFTFHRQSKRETETAKTTALSDLIDDLQAQVNSLTTRVDVQGTRMAEQDKKIDDLRRERKVLEDYVYKLRDHIYQQLPPPPPEWPKELTR